MKKIFYTFLLISPLLFISSCEEETPPNEENQGNSSLYIGMEAFGGMIFYIDETGEHGLVAAIEDLTEGAEDHYGAGFIGYLWGCDGENVTTGTSIGTGYQNTMNIVNQGCSTENGSITAAQAALDSEINGYSDWYLPSKDELVEMYNTIGNGGPEGNIGGFQSANTTLSYWSSSKAQAPSASVWGNLIVWSVYVGEGGYAIGNETTATGWVRVIRSF